MGNIDPSVEPMPAFYQTIIDGVAEHSPRGNGDITDLVEYLDTVSELTDSLPASVLAAAKLAYQVSIATPEDATLAKVLQFPIVHLSEYDPRLAANPTSPQQ